MKKYYFVEENEFKHILKGYIKYKALTRGGVNNWERYYDALAEYLKRWVKEESVNPSLRWDFEDISEDYANGYQKIEL